MLCWKEELAAVTDDFHLCFPGVFVFWCTAAPSAWYRRDGGPEHTPSPRLHLLRRLELLQKRSCSSLKFNPGGDCRLGLNMMNAFWPRCQTVSSGLQTTAPSLLLLLLLVPTVAYRSPNLGHRPPNLGHQSPNLGHRSPNLGHRSRNLGHRS